MLLRISEERRGDATRVRVEGHLQGDGVAELERTCRNVTGPVTLDLTALLTADEVGLSLLRSLRDAGAVVTGTSPFLRLLLNGSRNETRRRGDAA